MTDSALTTIEQKTVVFYDDELIAILADDGHIYVSVTQMCQALGINARTQRRRLQDHDVLAEGYKRGGLMTLPSESGRGGGQQQATLLRVDLIPLWLAGVRISRVKEEIRQKLKRYQREAAAVLWEAFQEGRLTAEPSLAELLSSDSPAARAYRMATAIQQLARHQLLLESRVGGVESRLEAIEARLDDPGRHISEEQASQISQSVKAVALELSKRSKRNEYGGVYGELYRKFGITSYKHLPVGKFETALSWLTEWHGQITGQVPF